MEAYVTQKSILISSQGDDADLQQQRNLYLKTRGEILIPLKLIAILPSASAKAVFNLRRTDL